MHPFDHMIAHGLFSFVVCEVGLGVGIIVCFAIVDLALFSLDVFDNVVQPIRVFMGLLFHVHSVASCCIVAC